METWKMATFFSVMILLSITVLAMAVLQVLPSVLNYSELQYAQLSRQFAPQIQIGYFTNAFYPINSRIPMATYLSMLNNTLSPQLISVTRYIASNGITAFPITTIAPITGSALVSPYTPSLNNLLYSATPLALNLNLSSYYVYPLYVVSYSVDCGKLTPVQQAQISSITSPMVKYYGSCTTNSTFQFQAILGASNNTATIADEVFEMMNPSYMIGSQNILQPISVYSANGVVKTQNNAINGTFLGYVASPSGAFSITNTNAQAQIVSPIRNIYKGNAYSGQVMLQDIYCWNSKYASLSNLLQNAKYQEYPYVFSYMNSSYMCLTVNATDSLLNATSNIDNSNFKFNPAVLNGNLLTNFPDYVIANRIAVADSYEYMATGVSTEIKEPILGRQYWFMPQYTNVFTLSTSPPYVFTQFIATQYSASTTLPLFGQNPNFIPLLINTTYMSVPVIQQALINNATNYLYAPLLQNLTYQYIFNASHTGTPVYCPSVCDYNNSLVYQVPTYAKPYPYEYANPNFGYLELPALNQTVYYNPEFAVIAQTPLVNDTNVQNSTYGHLCLYVSKYSCVYGTAGTTIPASEAFANAKNYSAFVIYGEGANATFVVNGFQIRGWNKTRNYINSLINNSRIVTISMLNQNGAAKWTVAGIYETGNSDYMIIAPQNFQINQGSYPQARTLTYNVYYLFLFLGIVLGVTLIGYSIASIKTQQIFGN